MEETEKKIVEKEITQEPAKENVAIDKKEKKSSKKKESKKPTGKERREEKIELEREYVVPMRKGSLKVPRYRRAKKSVRILKEFIAKHMKVEDRDVNKVKIDIYLNNEIWFKGIKKPLAKIKVKAVKRNGIVYVELADVPEAVKFKMNKDAKKKTKVDPKKIAKVIEQENAEKPHEAEETKEEKKTDSEDKKSLEESSEKINKAKAKAEKKTTSGKSTALDKKVITSKKPSGKTS